MFCRRSGNETIVDMMLTLKYIFVCVCVCVCVHLDPALTSRCRPTVETLVPLLVWEDRYRNCHMTTSPPSQVPPKSCPTTRLCFGSRLMGNILFLSSGSNLTPILVLYQDPTLLKHLASIVCCARLAASILNNVMILH